MTARQTRWPCNHLYKRDRDQRLWRALLLLVIFAINCGGCTLSSQVDTYSGGGRADHLAVHTVALSEQELETLPPADDLAYVRAAAADLLGRGEKDASVPWENPHSHARGTVAPIASAYIQDGQTCHHFLVSHVRSNAEAWMQGEACKRERGPWEVRSLKPWQRS